MFYSVHGIGTKLVSNWEHRMLYVYLKLGSFTSNKDVYVNRLESVFFDMLMCILQNRT